MTKDLKQKSETLKTEMLNAIYRFQEETGCNPNISILKISIETLHPNRFQSIYKVEVAIEL